METLDQDVVNIAKAIRQSESGGDFKAKGKSGEYGAYQFTPDTWKQQSSKYGISVPIEQATPEQQNEVAYRKLKEWKDSGKNVGQVASMWNAGEDEPDAYTGKFSNGKPSVGTNKFGAKYDVPAYAKSVASAYQTIKNGGQVNSDPNNPSSVNSQKTFDDIPDSGQSSSDDLQAGNPSALSKDKVTQTMVDFTPGTKLAQGLGYGLAAMTGSQKGLINANDRGIDIQGQLLKQIRDNKAKGKDTSKLEKALTELGVNLQDGDKKVSDVGTGGITNKEVGLSAAGLAALPVASYLGGALSGGGALNTGKGLTSGVLGKTSASAFANPAMKEILSINPAYGETVGTLPRSQAITRLTNALERLPVSEVRGAKGKLITKALQELNPTLVEKQSILSRILKGGFDTAKLYILSEVLGKTVGGLVHQNTN